MMPHDEIEEVRVIPADRLNTVGAIQALPERERTGPQQHIDHALEQAMLSATTALDAAQEAIDWLGTLTSVTNRNVPIYIGQLIAEIREAARLRQ